MKFYSIVWVPEQVVAPLLGFVVALLLVFMAPMKVGITSCSGKEGF